MSVEMQKLRALCLRAGLVEASDGEYVYYIGRGCIVRRRLAPGERVAIEERFRLPDEMRPTEVWDYPLARAKRYFGGAGPSYAPLGERRGAKRTRWAGAYAAVLSRCGGYIIPVCGLTLARRIESICGARFRGGIAEPEERTIWRGSLTSREGTVVAMVLPTKEGRR